MPQRRGQGVLRWCAAVLCLASASYLAALAQAPPQAPARPGDPAGPAPSTATTGASTISGIVHDAVSSRPLAGAIVSLGRVDRLGTPGPRMVTDAKGRFVFSNLPASDSYYLDARRFGYASTRYGWTAPGGTSAVSAIRRIKVADKEWVSTIDIPLWRYGAIAGRVIDERSEPVVGVAVRAFTTANISGNPQLVAGPLATTDDRGVYRLSGLAAGRYIVSVLSVQSTVLASTPESPQLRPVGELASGGIGSSRGNAVSAPAIDVDGRHRLVMTNFATPPPPADGRARAYPGLFYPGVTNWAEATSLEIAYGDNRAGTDFQLRPLPAVRVAGRLVSTAELPASFLLRLMPVGSERMGFGSEAATTTSDRDGTFTFLNVPEGHYTILAQASVVDFTSGSSSTRMPDAPGFPGGGIRVGGVTAAPGLESLARNGEPAPVWGRTSLSVGASDVNDVAVTLHPAVKIRGRVVFADGAAPANLHLGLTAHPANGDATLGQPSGDAKQGESGLSFEVAGLIVGRYLLNADVWLRSTPGGGPNEGYRGPLGLVSVMSEGRDVIDTGFDASLGRDFDDVVVTLTTKTAAIKGVVRGDKGPAAAAVIVFPVEHERWVNYGWEPRRFRSRPAATDGTYQLDALTEGEYFVVAVDPSQVNAWVNPKFLAAAAPFATKVSVKWGDALTQDLKLVEVVVK